MSLFNADFESLHLEMFPEAVSPVRLADLAHQGLTGGVPGGSDGKESVC